MFLFTCELLGGNEYLLYVMLWFEKYSRFIRFLSEHITVDTKSAVISGDNARATRFDFNPDYVICLI